MLPLKVQKLYTSNIYSVTGSFNKTLNVNDMISQEITNKKTILTNDLKVKGAIDTYILKASIANIDHMQVTTFETVSNITTLLSNQYMSNFDVGVLNVNSNYVNYSFISNCHSDYIYCTNSTNENVSASNIYSEDIITSNIKAGYADLQSAYISDAYISNLDIGSIKTSNIEANGMGVFNIGTFSNVSAYYAAFSNLHIIGGIDAEIINVDALNTYSIATCNITSFNGSFDTLLLANNFKSSNISTNTLTCSNEYILNSFSSNIFSSNIDSINVISDFVQASNAIINQTYIDTSYTSIVYGNNGSFSNLKIIENTCCNCYIDNAYISNIYLINANLSNLTAVESHLYTTFIQNAVASNVYVDILYTSNANLSNAFINELATYNTNVLSNLQVNTIYSTNSYLDKVNASNVSINTLYASNANCSNVCTVYLHSHNIDVTSNLTSKSSYTSIGNFSNAYIDDLYVSDLLTSNITTDRGMFNNCYTSNAYIQSIFGCNVDIKGNTNMYMTHINEALFVDTIISSNNIDIYCDKTITFKFFNDKTSNYNFTSTITKEGYTVVSDANKKTNIVPLINSLDKVLQIGGYKYLRVDTDVTEVGLLAQEVEKVIPEAISYFPDATLGIKYERIIPLLVEAIKELNTKINNIL